MGENEVSSITIDIPRVRPFRVVISGGPAGGKTSLIEWIHLVLKVLGEKVITQQEVVTFIGQRGLDPSKYRDDPEKWEMYQRFVAMLTMMLEDTAMGYGMKGGTGIITFDRGLIDVEVYGGEELFAQILKDMGLTREDVYDRYDMVIHMTTAALGAEEAYLDTTNNGVRYETLEEAQEIDRKQVEAWQGHPNFHILTNEYENFRKKLSAGLNLLMKHYNAFKAEEEKKIATNSPRTEDSD